MCADQASNAQCVRCGKMYMVKNYASLQAMGCIKPYPGQRRLGAVSTGRRLGWVWAAGSWIWKDMDKPLANGECTYERCGHGYWDAMEDDENVGGGRIYGEYNKGPVKVGGEWEFDEEEDQSVGYGDDFGQPSHTRAHRPDSQSISNYYNNWRL